MRPRRVRHAAAVGAALLPLLAACDGNAVSDGGARRDSAGVAIVESAGPAWGDGEGWRVDQRPLLEVGMEEGEEPYLFSRVTGAVRMGDGRIAVADRGAKQVRLFDAAGRHLLSMGREGSGPGEFGSLDRLVLGPGDTLLAYDGMQNRVTVLAPEGRFVRVAAMPTTGGAPLWYAGRFDDGTLLLTRPATLRPDARPGLRRDTLTYLRTNVGTERLDSIAALPGSESLVVAQGAGSATYRRALTVDPTALTSGDSLFFATGEGFAVEVMGADGRLRRRVRAAVPMREVTAEDRAGFHDGMLERARGPARARVEAMLTEMPFPRALPAVDRLMVDAEGNLWTSEFQRPGESGGERWNVIDRSGRWLGAVAMPDGFRASQVGRDFVLGVARDSTDVERVRLHRLTRSVR